MVPVPPHAQVHLVLDEPDPWIPEQPHDRNRFVAGMIVGYDKFKILK